MIASRPASELVPGDVLPMVTYGHGAEVASVVDAGNARRVTFTEPVQARFSPGSTIAGLTLLASDAVFVRVQWQCEAEWPSPVTGGMTDAQCVNDAETTAEGTRLCAECAVEVTA